MKPNELKELLSTRPFEPIRVELSTGETFDVSLPENAIVLKSKVIVAKNVENGIADYVTHYSLLHVVKVEPLNGNRKSANRNSKRK